MPDTIDVYPPPRIETVEVYGGARGVKGDKGDPGVASDAQVANSVNAYLAANPVAPQAYEYDQPIASAEWIINHNLGFKPNVNVIDTAGTTIEPGKVTYNGTSQLTIYFNFPFAGSAYLS